MWQNPHGCYLCSQQSCEVDFRDHLVSTLRVTMSIIVLRFHLITSIIIITIIHHHRTYHVNIAQQPVSIPWAVRLSWLENASHTHFFRQAISIRKVGHTDLVLACDQGSLVGLSTQHYNSLHAAVVICSTMVNIQTHTLTHRYHLNSWFDKLIQLSLKTHNTSVTKHLVTTIITNVWMNYQVI